MAPPPSPSFLLDWRGADGEVLGVISVSGGRARVALEEGLRLPSSRLRPSPKPIATEGTPIARMREHTTAARPEKRKDFMTDVTLRTHSSCALKGHCQSHVSALALAGLLDRVDRNVHVQIERGADDPRLLDGVR